MSEAFTVQKLNRSFVPSQSLSNRQIGAGTSSIQSIDATCTACSHAFRAFQGRGKGGFSLGANNSAAIKCPKCAKTGAVSLLGK